MNRAQYPKTLVLLKHGVFAPLTIIAQPGILSTEWMLIGRQVDTGFGGRLDLLAIAPDGALVLVELKRDRTPRDVVAQALDYASWVERQESADISAIYARFKPGGSLAADFRNKFGQPLDEDTLNESHQIVIVAASLDASSERIVNYLNDRGLPINVLFFQIFNHGGQQFLSRAWLIDPGEVQVHAANTTVRGEKEPWNGEFYVSFSNDKTRLWDEAVGYGFISGGGGTWSGFLLGFMRRWRTSPGTGIRPEAAPTSEQAPDPRERELHDQIKAAPSGNRQFHASDLCRLIGQAAYEARVLEIIRQFGCPRFTATLAVHGRAVIAGEIAR